MNMIYFDSTNKYCKHDAITYKVLNSISLAFKQSYLVSGKERQKNILQTNTFSYEGYRCSFENCLVYSRAPIQNYIFHPTILAAVLSLWWRHNERDSVSHHQPHDCLVNRLFRRRSKKTSKLRVTGLCVGISPGTGEFPAQMASYAANVSIWWRHHVTKSFYAPSRNTETIWLYNATSTSLLREYKSISPKYQEYTAMDA